MGFKFATLLCLLVVLHGSYASKVQTPRRLNTDFVTKSGSITINKDTYGYYVNADLGYNYYDASDSEGYDSYIAQMNLALYTSQTLFSSNCLSYNTYYCSAYGCSEYTWTTANASYPDFDVMSGYPASANLYLDYENWELNSNAIIASSCDDSTYSSYGYSRYGILALGMNQTLSNFINTSMFSISLARDGSSGTLLFWSNEDAIAKGSYTGQLSASEDFQIAPSSIYMSMKDSSLSTTAGLIFDLNSVGIGLPTYVYYDIISDLQEAAVMSCTSDLYSPLCYYSGKIGDLPTITLTIQGVDIQIPPTVYVQDETDEDTYVNEVTLNFRLVDPSYTGYNYISEAFANYIIFDSSIMSYYYTEFSYNGGSPTITLYSPYSDKIIWPYIVGGVLGFTAIVFIVCCCIRKRKVRLAQQAALRAAEGINTSEQSPLVTNIQVNLPYPAQNYPAPVAQPQAYPTQIPAQTQVYPPQTAAQTQAYPPQNYPPYGYEHQQGYGYPQFPNQPNANLNANPVPYGGYGNGNVQPGAYNNYMPPQQGQGQFYGNGQGYIPPAQVQPRP